MIVNAIVLIKVERGKVNDVAQHVVNIDGVSDVFSVAGRFDLVAVLHAHSNEHVADIVTKAVQGQSGITDTETLLAFKAYSKADIEAAFSIGNDEKIS
jgi:DNA-binding Lrp family transcriptional regulator